MKLCTHVSAAEQKRTKQHFPFSTARRLSECFHSSLTGQRRKYCKQSATQAVHLCGLAYWIRLL